MPVAGPMFLRSRSVGRSRLLRTSREAASGPSGVHLAAAGVAGAFIGGFFARQASAPAGSTDDQHAHALCGAFRLDDNGTDGTLVYEPDGRFTHTYMASRGVLVGTKGKWWAHDNKSSFAATYPPHDGQCVEHDVLATSSRDAQKRTSDVYRYTLSADGQQLTLSIMELRDGASVPKSSTLWRRIF